MLKKILTKLKKKKEPGKLPSAEAYKLWSTFYDDQPDNVVLHLEGKLFSEILSMTEIEGKKILDIGCGTGRHWKQILSHQPQKLTGIDNSKEMTSILKSKFSDAEVFYLENNSLKDFKENSFDVIISTLTIGHIKNIEDYFREWDRVLKPGGEILITDFHPVAFSTGMKRSFVINKQVIEVENYLYEVEILKKMFEDLNWKLVLLSEKIINEEVKYFFVKQNFIAAYDKYYGTPLILGLSLAK